MVVPYLVPSIRPNYSRDKEENTNSILYASQGILDPKSRSIYVSSVLIPHGIVVLFFFLCSLHDHWIWYILMIPRHGITVSFCLLVESWENLPNLEIPYYLVILSRLGKLTYSMYPNVVHRTYHSATWNAFKHGRPRTIHGKIGLCFSKCFSQLTQTELLTT